MFLSHCFPSCPSSLPDPKRNRPPFDSRLPFGTRLQLRNKHLISCGLPSKTIPGHVMWSDRRVERVDRFRGRCGRVSFVIKIYIEQELGNKILSIKSLSLEWIWKDEKPHCDTVSATYLAKIHRKSFQLNHDLPASLQWILKYLWTPKVIHVQHLGIDGWKAVVPERSSPGSLLSPCAILIGTVSWCNSLVL